MDDSAPEQQIFTVIGLHHDHDPTYVMVAAVMPGRVPDAQFAMFASEEEWTRFSMVVRASHSYEAAPLVRTHGYLDANALAWREMPCPDWLILDDED